MDAWLQEQRRTPAGSAPPAPNLRRRTGSSTSNHNSLGTERARSASGRSNHSRGGDAEDQALPFPSIIVERKEPEPDEEQEEQGGAGRERSSSSIARHPAAWFNCSLCAFVGATLSWYCWGLVFLSPLGPSRNVIQPHVARWSHRLGPGSFYALQVGRLVGVPFFGHLGDRYGRRSAFPASMAVVGVATAAMGCFFPLRQNGEGHGLGLRSAWTVLRFLVGAGVAGQCPANILVPMESCGSEKAGAMAAAVGHAGMPVGLALAAAAAYACILWEGGTTHFPEGLRLAQWAGVLLVPTALWAFAAAEEGEVFKQVEEAGEKERRPLLVLLRTRGCGLVGGSFAVALDSFVKCAVVFYWPVRSMCFFVHLIFRLKMDKQQSRTQTQTTIPNPNTNTNTHRSSCRTAWAAKRCTSTPASPSRCSSWPFSRCWGRRCGSGCCPAVVCFASGRLSVPGGYGAGSAWCAPTSPRFCLRGISLSWASGWA